MRYARGMIAIGIVAKDAEESARFHTEAIAFTEVKGFPVPGELGKKIERIGP